MSGAIYAGIVAGRMRQQMAFWPQFEDWLLHVVLPAVAYALLALSAAAASVRAREALFAVGAASPMLLFAGIHDAWDAVAYHVLVSIRNAQANDSE